MSELAIYNMENLNDSIKKLEDDSQKAEKIINDNDFSAFTDREIFYTLSILNRHEGAISKFKIPENSSIVFDADDTISQTIEKRNNVNARINDVEEKLTALIKKMKAEIVRFYITKRIRLNLDGILKGMDWSDFEETLERLLDDFWDLMNCSIPSLIHESNYVYDGLTALEKYLVHTLPLFANYTTEEILVDCNYYGKED